MKEITLQVPDGMTVEWADGVFKLIAEKDNRPVTERIRTFEDACRELGELNDLVKHWRWIEKAGPDRKDTNAYFKLCIIAAALNEGWEPQFTEDEYRWFPWFRLYTQKEIDKMDEEGKHRVVFRSSSYAHAGGGVAYAFAYYDSAISDAYYGSRLAFKSKELAEYAGKQFIDIWADFVYC